MSSKEVKITLAAIAAALGIAASEAQAKQVEYPRDFPPLFVLKIENSDEICHVGFKHTWVEVKDSLGNVIGVKYKGLTDEVIGNYPYEVGQVMWLVQTAIEWGVFTKKNENQILYRVYPPLNGGNCPVSVIINKKPNLYPYGTSYTILPLDSIVAYHPSGDTLIDRKLDSVVDNNKSQAEYNRVLDAFTNWNKPPPEVTGKWRQPIKKP